ncbi:MAG: serine/threonine protein phosphatase, partial [Pseudoflavonifractor sp.]
MGFWERKKPEKSAGAPVQLRDGGRHPFGLLDGYVPLKNGELALYRSIREAVPILDAAVLKLIRLAGGVIVKSENADAQAGLDRFLRTVETGRGQRGIQSFLDGYLDSMLTCGRAVGEMVLDRRRSEVAAVLCGNVADIEVREGETPMDFALCARNERGEMEELPCQRLLLFTPFQPETDSPYGVSLLRSMPFLTEILLKIYNAIGMNWERMGNVRFAVVYKPGDDAVDRAYAKERSEQIAAEWSAAMQAGKNGTVRDFVAVGDVDIKVIGADNQILDSQ